MNAEAKFVSQAARLANLELDEIPDTVWRLLQVGAERASDPLHTPSLATIGHEGPQLRTVVLRHVDAGQRLIVCHTDRRASKAGEILQDPRTSWHWYDRDRKLQLRLSGTSFLHTDDPLADACWDRSTKRARTCYNTAIGPGQRVSRPPVAPPSIGSDPEEADARSHFAAIATRVTFIDWLFLSGGGHRRARYHWRSDGFTGSWTTP